MIVILDLGSHENTVLARAIRALGVYSEIYPHDITKEELQALPNVKGVIINGGPNNVIDGVEIDVLPEIYEAGYPVMAAGHAKALCEVKLEQFTNDEEAIKSAVRSRIEYLFDGDMEEFEAVARTMGFDYNDFLEGTKMLYKYSNAKAAIFGADGSNLVGAYADCDKYFEEYSHVKLLFIRTESEYVTDESGNRVLGSDGKDKTEPLNSAEKDKRIKDIAAIDAAIAALESGDNFQMSAEYFDSFLEKYSYDKEFDMGGYYFAPASEYTALYYEAIDGKAIYKDIAEAALEADIGDFVKVEYEDGVCYVYKYEREQYAYAKERYEEFFEDFYSDAATYLFPEILGLLSDEVTVKDRFYDIDPVYIPYNTYIVAKVEN